MAASGLVMTAGLRPGRPTDFLGLPCSLRQLGELSYFLSRLLCFVLTSCFPGSPLRCLLVGLLQLFLGASAPHSCVILLFASDSLLLFSVLSRAHVQAVFGTMQDSHVLSLR